MGISKNTMDLIEQAVDLLGMNFSGLKMCEFGAQEIRKSGFAAGHPIKHMNIAKDYFVSLDSIHVSMDINEKYGSINVDLSKPVEDWRHYFDILTDFGTIEHIKNGQYQAFKNAHDFVRSGGIMIHSLPMVGRIQLYHSPSTCVYYEPDFFDKLSKANSYGLIYSNVWNNKPGRGGGNLTVMMQRKNNEFISELEFNKIKEI